MNITGRVTLTGGQLSGVGTIDSVTAWGGTVAPGGSSTGALTVGGAVTFNASATLSIFIDAAQMRSSRPGVLSTLAAAR